MKNKIVTILVDNNSWILPYAIKLKHKLIETGYPTRFVSNPKDIDEGWINFMLGCTKLIDASILKKNKHNLVVHESDLPLGRGFAPMAWQIIEGKNEIPICLIEADTEADSGLIWIKDTIRLSGSELCAEWRELQGMKTIELCYRFIEEYEHLKATPQQVISTWYKRRKPEDSKLDIKKTIEEQFNLLRTVDNERYPAFFDLEGNRYIIKIESTNKIG